MLVVDDFCPRLDRIIDSAKAAGFGTWKPNPGHIGSSNYEGMGFWGLHAHMMLSLSMATQSVIYPNSMFFRYTTPAMERAYIHSDRETGAFTCVAYLSAHDDVYGTAFYRHKASGLTHMPAFAQMEKYPTMRADIVAGPEPWEQTDFVQGRKNRAVIFDAPLFHSRIPLGGIGNDPDDARMVWVSHFHTPESLSEVERG